MAPFEYLIAFVSVVLALAIAHALGGLLKIIERRETARADWVPLVWTLALLVWSVFFWWFTYGRAGREAADFHVLHLFYVLGYAGALYVLFGLLYPHEIPAGFDMRAHFEANRRWFFSALLVLGAFDLGDTAWSLLAGLPSPPWLYWLLMGVWIFGSATALMVRDRRYHAVYALVFTILVTIQTVLNRAMDGVRTLMLD